MTNTLSTDAPTVVRAIAEVEAKRLDLPRVDRARIESVRLFYDGAQYGLDLALAALRALDGIETDRAMILGNRFAPDGPIADHFIPAIKALRDATSTSLKDAKDRVEAIVARDRERAS